MIFSQLATLAAIMALMPTEPQPKMTIEEFISGADSVENRTGTCLNSAAHGRDVCQIHVLVHLDGTFLIDYGMCGKGGLTEEHGNGLAVLKELGFFRLRRLRRN